MIFFLRLSRATLDLTRGISDSLCLDEALDALRVTPRRHEGGAAQVPLPLGSFLREDVALVGLHTPDLSRAGHLEALGSALMRFHLHRFSPAAPSSPART